MSIRTVSYKLFSIRAGRFTTIFDWAMEMDTFPFRLYVAGDSRFEKTLSR